MRRPAVIVLSDVNCWRTNENMHDARHALPIYYDDLDASLAEAWRLLVRGAADRKSPIHTPAIASIGVDGAPKVRVVVLRAADPASRTLRFHTDRRGQKIAEFAACPLVQIIAYDPHQKIQLRLSAERTSTPATPSRRKRGRGRRRKVSFAIARR